MEILKVIWEKLEHWARISFFQDSWKRFLSTPDEEADRRDIYARDRHPIRETRSAMKMTSQPGSRSLIPCFSDFVTSTPRVPITCWPSIRVFSEDLKVKSEVDLGGGQCGVSSSFCLKDRTLGSWPLAMRSRSDWLRKRSPSSKGKIYRAGSVDHQVKKSGWPGQNFKNTKLFREKCLNY